MVGLSGKGFDIFETGKLFEALRKEQKEGTAVLFERLAEQEKLSHSDLGLVFMQAQQMGLDVATWLIKTDIRSSDIIDDVRWYVQKTMFPDAGTPPLNMEKERAAPLLLAMAAKLRSLNNDSTWHDEEKRMKACFLRNAKLVKGK